MTNRVCEMLDCEFPILAFSHCRDVVAAVSKAGGFGVLGATAHTPDPETLATLRKGLDARLSEFAASPEAAALEDAQELLEPGPASLGDDRDLVGA